jgi:hypothetical protein
MALETDFCQIFLDFQHDIAFGLPFFVKGFNAPVKSLIVQVDVQQLLA